MKSLFQQFHQTLTASDAAPGGVSGPSRLAAAAGSALGSDATVISLLSQPSMQMPIGFDGADAAVAEQLQFGIDSGPALDAHRLGLPLLANSSTTAACWPAFHRELLRRTAFCAVASIPLRHGPARVGVLDLYFVRAIDTAGFPIDDAESIGEHIVGRLLSDGYVTDFGELGPSWLINHATQPRGKVSVAMGMLCLVLRVSAETALELIRGHAASTRLTVDDVSLQITAGTLSPHRLGDPAEAPSALH